MNLDIGKNEQSTHKVTMRARESMEIHGVTDVISFDEQMVVLTTTSGTLTVEGSLLHIHVLSMESGVVTMDGKIDSLVYSERETDENGSKGGFFGKLFR